MMNNRAWKSWVCEVKREEERKVDRVAFIFFVLFSIVSILILFCMSILHGLVAILLFSLCM